MTLSIERRAALWGDRTAIVDVSEEALYAPAETIHEDRVSYAELADLARASAAALADRDVEAGDTVAVLSRDRIAVVAALFACRRLGATLAPVSHRLTPATVDRPLARLDPVLVVYERAQRDLVRAVAPPKKVALDDLDGESSDPTDAVDRSRNDCRGTDTPLLAIHGAGGTPVARFDAETVERHCVTAAATWGLGRRDRTTTVVPLASYDGLCRVALPLLYVGGRLAIDRAFDPGDARTAIRRDRSTFLVGRETSFRELLAGDDVDEALASVEWAVGEAPVDDAVASAFRERGVQFARAYGRPECPNALAAAPDQATGSDRDVGAPMLDCAARLVEDGDVVTGPGEGTLQLSGPVVASGYVSRDDPKPTSADDETRDPEPSSADDEDRPGRFRDDWFDTGDRFRRDHDGRYHPFRRSA